MHVDLDRWLPATDTVGRDLFVSCGAALHHLRAALAAVGVSAHVEREPRTGPPSLVATVHLGFHAPAEADLRTAAAIAHRRTDRRRFAAWPVPEVFLDELAELARREGAWLRPVTGPGEADLVRAARAAAERARATATGVGVETTLWTARPVGDDGIPSANLLADAPGTGDGLAREFRPGTIEQEPGQDGALLVALATASDEPSDQIRAGEALSAVLLHATDLGLASCPLTEPLEVEETYQQVRAGLFGRRCAPQALVRLGWAPSEPLPPTPRRPVDDVLERREPTRHGGRP